MKQNIKSFLSVKWWIPLLFFVLASIFFVAVFSSEYKSVQVVGNTIFLLSIAFLLIVGVFQLIKGKWQLGLLQLGVLITGSFLLMGFSTIMVLMGPDTDSFADNLKLPENVKLEYPKALQTRTTAETITELGLDQNKEGEFRFQLYNSFQPGLYEYDLWISSEKNGSVYLKAFEITQNVQLTKRKLTKNSSVGILKTNGKILKFGTQDHFTIHEGVWGKPYAARFEIWFQPENESNEIKLGERNYVIEGWMR